MFARIFYAACLAGVVAGLLLSGLQALLTTPLIREAETYERGMPAAPGAGERSHEHDGAWAPAGGLERTLFTSLANVGLAIGFGLLLCALYALRQPVSWRQGLGWGLAGFLVFFVSPALGLHPELPGASAAPLADRQAWWLAAVAGAAAGLGLVVLARPWGLRLLGLVVIGLPHLWGAPAPELPASLAPAELERRFVVATSVVNGLFWIIIGVVSAVAMRHLSAEPE